jgi:hypothetical protein
MRGRYIQTVPVVNVLGAKTVVAHDVCNGVVVERETQVEDSKRWWMLGGDNGSTDESGS